MTLPEFHQQIIERPHEYEIFDTKLKNNTTMETIKLTKTSLTKKPGTKTVWIKEETEARTISRDEYRKIIEAAPFFRRLGGSEHLERSYTSSGYMVTRLVSTSPDRMTRRVYDFHI